jgi:hypothetical protein
VQKLWKYLGGLTPRKIYQSRISPVFTRVSAEFWVALRRRRLQAVGWFVTTVKHGTALEALARRRSRLDISEI